MNVSSVSGFKGREAVQRLELPKAPPKTEPRIQNETGASVVRNENGAGNAINQRISKVEQTLRDLLTDVSRPTPEPRTESSAVRDRVTDRPLPTTPEGEGENAPVVDVVRDRPLPSNNEQQPGAGLEAFLQFQEKALELVSSIKEYLAGPNGLSSQPLQLNQSYSLSSGGELLINGRSPNTPTTSSSTESSRVSGNGTFTQGQTEAVATANAGAAATNTSGTQPSNGAAGQNGLQRVAKFTLRALSSINQQLSNPTRVNGNGNGNGNGNAFAPGRASLQLGNVQSLIQQIGQNIGSGGSSNPATTPATTVNVFIGSTVNIET